VSVATRRSRGRPRSFEDADAFRAATYLLLTGGIAHLTLQRVADRVGCSHQALGQRFSSREGLLNAYLDWLIALNVSTIESVIANSPSPLAAARTIWMLPVDPAEVGLPEGVPHVVSSILSLQLRQDPALRDRITELYRSAPTVFLDLIRAAQEQGELRRDADPDDILEAVLVASTGAGIHWTMNPSEDLIAKIIRCRERALAPYLA